MGKIVWQFSTEASLSGILIRYGTRSDWSHVDAVLPDGTLLGARIDGGVKVRQPGYANFTETRRYVVETDCADKFYEALLSQTGKPYDWKAVVAFVIGDRDWQDTSKWFCSELQVWAMLQADFFNNHQKQLLVQTDRMSPRDQILLFSPWLVLYE